MDWIRNRKQESIWLIDSTDDDSVHAADQIDLVENYKDPVDLEVELERHELADLIDRAMSALPSTTRTVLIQRYIEDEPQSEIARRLKTSEGAIEARIHRGKLALRHILTTQLQSEAIAYGLCPAQPDRFEETRIWCPNCGQRHLQGYFKTGDLSRTLELQCPHCAAHSSMGDVPGLFDGIHGYRAALSRLAHWHHGFFEHALTRREVKCQRCGHPTPAVVIAEFRLDPTVSCAASCPSCGQWAIQTDAIAIALNLPQAQAFWREHQRIATRPLQSIQTSAGSSVLITLQSIRSRATLDMVLAGESLTLLPI